MSAPVDPTLPDRGARAVRTLVAATIIGIMGDVLLRGGMWRSGFSLWIALVVIAALALDGRDRERRVMLLGLFAAALGLALRDADYLWPIDFLSTLCMGALVVWHGTGRRIADFTLVQAARAPLLSLITMLGGASVVLRDGVAQGGGTAEAGRRARAIGIGALLAVPPIFLVAVLLGQSDAVFGSFVDRFGTFLEQGAVRHAVVASVLAWAAAGWMRAASGDGTLARVIDPPSPSVPFLTVSVGLYGLIGLLALYLGTQARALFGGASYLLATAGLTRAEYARNGFFEMIAATGIVLATLAVADWLLGSEEAPARRRFRAAGTVLVAQIIAILGSAVVRMWLYVSEFGLTIDRALAFAAMCWVLATLLAFALTTLRGRSARFAAAVLGVTVGWVAALNLANLEGLVVRVNVARAAAGAEFDWSYHSQLSADALPTLRAHAPRLGAADCARLEAALLEVWAYRGFLGASAGRGDWRANDLPRAAALTWAAEDGRLGCAQGAVR